METDRRGFLSILAGTAVLAMFPKAPGATEPSMATRTAALNILDSVKAPPGMTYMWVRTALFGDPDPENVKRRLDNGWTFVKPERHADITPIDGADAFIHGGLVLMERPTNQVTQEYEKERQKVLDQTTHFHNGLPRSVFGFTNDGKQRQTIGGRQTAGRHSPAKLKA